jgi:presenilin-like A22 family membrane protease
MWAVWKSGIMQKMAKYQMNELKIFSGFFIPYISKKVRMGLKGLSKSELKKKKIKANVAILGGGDVVFPVITAGVMLKDFGLWPAIFVIIGAALGLSYLLFFAEKKKFYPAMPFITAGIFLGILVSRLLL